MYPETWKIIKSGNSFYYKDEKTMIKLNTKHVYSKGMRENVCLAIKVALDLKIDKKIIQKKVYQNCFLKVVSYLKKVKNKKKLQKMSRLWSMELTHALG